MALVAVEFVGHHKFGGRLVRRLEPSDSVAVYEDGGFVVVKMGGLVTRIPMMQVSAIISTDEKPKDKK